MTPEPRAKVVRRCSAAAHGPRSTRHLTPARKLAWVILRIDRYSSGRYDRDRKRVRRTRAYGAARRSGRRCRTQTSPGSDSHPPVWAAHIRHGNFQGCPVMARVARICAFSVLAPPAEAGRPHRAGPRIACCFASRITWVPLPIDRDDGGPHNRSFKQGGIALGVH